MKTIKLFKPCISPKVNKALINILHSGYIAEGEEVKKFESEFARYFHKKNCAAVNSGSSALELAYELADIRENDEVIAPVMTFIGANVLLAKRKVKIKFADIDPNNFNLDINDVKRKITAKTKAIIFVHFGGNNENLSEVLALGKKYKIKIIEDAAQAIGSKKWGLADYTAVSFQAIKMLTTGDGGMLICKKKEDLMRARKLRWFGMDRDKRQKEDFADVSEPGYKFHMNNIAAVIGRMNLRGLDKIIEHRHKLIKAYKSYNFSPKTEARLILGVWCCSVITDKRDELRNYLKENGIQTAIYHYRNDKYAIFKSQRHKLINMDRLEKKYFLVPMHHDISTRDVKYICDTIANFYKAK